MPNRDETNCFYALQVIVSRFTMQLEELPLLFPAVVIVYMEGEARRLMVVISVCIIIIILHARQNTCYHGMWYCLPDPNKSVIAV